MRAPLKSDAFMATTVYKTISTVTVMLYTIKYVNIINYGVATSQPHPLLDKRVWGCTYNITEGVANPSHLLTSDNTNTNSQAYT